MKKILSRALCGTDSESLGLAIEVVNERGMPQLNAGLVAAFENSQQPRSVRIRATVALARRGDRRGVNFVRECWALRNSDQVDLNAGGCGVRGPADVLARRPGER